MDEQVGDARRGLDQTTGLPDARRVVEALDLSLTRAAAAGLDIAIVALDIDDMESLNDRYGRDVGDRVLAAVASCLVDQARRFDIVARIEGDEFMVVLLDAGVGVATAWAELARAALEELEVPPVASRINAAFGVAVHDGAESGNALVERADEAMLQARLAGGNPVVVSGRN
jgi:diguanylate cyclase (GGDEF)-like protein